MNILIANENYNAHYFVRLGLARAFSALGHNAILWDITKKPALDMFDEFNPDIFLGQSYNLDRPTMTAILERPHLRVVLKAGDHGQMSREIDLKEYPVLIATEKEKDNVFRLKEECGEPSFLEIHYHEDYINYTHGDWIKEGVPVFSQLSAADLAEFTVNRGRVDPRFECDIVFIGGYWPYKAKVLDKWLLPLVDKYNVKIFGNSEWPTTSYCGFLRPEYTATALMSAKICVNLHEPHSQVFGHDIIERPFKLLSCKTFVVSDYVEGLSKLIPSGIVHCKTPELMTYEIEMQLTFGNDESRSRFANEGYLNVVNNHTYFHRATQILDRLGFKEEAMKAKLKTKELIGKITGLSVTSNIEGNS